MLIYKGIFTYFFFVQHLPQTETGKPDRATARKVALEIASTKKK
jgi:acyl-coenzyme A synthetase/AMP-(fatty) acid ligase